MTTIAEVLHDLYAGFDFAPEGEDYSLNVTESDREVAASQARYWSVVNEARLAAGVLEWDGVLMAATLNVRAESNPNLLSDRLLELAAVALTYAQSAQRQTDALNEEGE